jgi:outer membrane lipoprotein-sorting protein
MEEKFVGVVEEVKGRKVIAFLSQVHFNPDISQETFVLEPQAGDAAPEG